MIIRQNTIKRIRGFTLIELLVVVSIIALLISILLPAISKAREQAKLVLCATNQHQLLLGLVAYSTANEDRLPPTPSRNFISNGYHRPTELNWQNNFIGLTQDDVYAGKYLSDYLPTVEVFNCPLAPIAPTSAWPPTTSGLPAVGTYGEFYLSGGYTPLHSTYILLWNFQGFNHDVHAGASREHFEGTTNMGSKNKLVVQDSLFYLTSNRNLLWPSPQRSWFSSHPFENSQHAKPYHTLFDSGETELPDVWLNAGYIDGRVERFHSFDTTNVMNINASVYLTSSFR